MYWFDDGENEPNESERMNQDSIAPQIISVSNEPQMEAANLNGFSTQFSRDMLKIFDIYLPSCQEDEYKLELPGVCNQIETNATTSNAQLLLEKSQLPGNHGYGNNVKNSQDPIIDEGSINNYPYNTRHSNPPNDFINNGIIQEISQESPLVSGLNKNDRDFETSGKSINSSLWKLKEMVVDKTQAINGNRKATNDLMETDDIVTQKRPRIESIGYGRKLISTVTREKGTSSHFATEMNATANGIAFDELGGASVSSIHNVHASPGPSGHDEQKYPWTLRAEDFHSEEQQQNVESTYICLICRKTYDEHVDTSSEYKCCVCNYKNNQKSSIRSHIIYYGRHHFFCRLCEDAFKKKGLHDIDKICSICKPYKQFPCRTFLVEHLYCEHHQVCPLCQKDIHDHIIEEKNYKCCVCTCEFNHVYKLQNHFPKCFMEKPFKCDICGVRVKWSASLWKHKKNKHSAPQNRATF